MRKVLSLVVVAALSVLVTPTFATEGPAPAPAVQPAAAAPAPVVSLTVEQLQILLAQAKPVVAAQATAEPAAVKASVVTADGIFGFTWGQLLGGLGSLLVLVFGALKGATALKVRRMVTLAAETGWLVAERLGSTFPELTGAQKAALALGEFLKAFSAEGVPVTPGSVTQAQAIFTSKSAAAGLQATPATPAPSAEELAKAKAAAAAAAGGTATDLANKAAS